MKLEKKGISVFDFFTIGFGAIVGVGWAVIVNDWMAASDPRGGRIPAYAGIGSSGSHVLCGALPDASGSRVQCSLWVPGVWRENGLHFGMVGDYGFFRCTPVGSDLY